LSVISSTGRVVFHTIVSPGGVNLSIPVTAWPAGLYLLRLDAKGNTVTRRVVVVH